MQNSRLALRSNHRTHLDFLFQAIPGADCGSNINDSVGELFLYIAHSHCHRNCEASLSCTSERTVADDFCGHFEIGIWHDNHKIFRPALALHPFTVCRTLAVRIISPPPPATHKKNTTHPTIDQ